jgi:hypothetical protein
VCGTAGRVCARGVSQQKRRANASRIFYVNNGTQTILILARVYSLQYHYIQYVVSYILSTYVRTWYLRVYVQYYLLVTSSLESTVVVYHSTLVYAYSLSRVLVIWHLSQ